MPDDRHADGGSVRSIARHRRELVSTASDHQHDAEDNEVGFIPIHLVGELHGKGVGLLGNGGWDAPCLSSQESGFRFGAGASREASR